MAARKFLRDQGGNAFILTAAALIPIIGFVGSSVDIGRGYMAKLRLQQACDAGVLAGRRAMAAGQWTDAAKAEANKMFAFNYPANLYGSHSVSFTPTSPSTTDVTGKAKASLPTAIMHIFPFGFSGFDLEVDCTAKLEISNTDVMLVLDVTGSMAGSPLKGLQNASNVFLSTLTSAEMGDGRLRVGVVPYSGAVNVGRVLYSANSKWLSDQVTLPSRYWDSSNKDYVHTNRTFDVSSMDVGGSKTFDTGRKGGNDRVYWRGCVTERQTTAFGSTSQAPSAAYDMNIDMVPTSDDATKWKRFLPHLVYSRTSSWDTRTSSDNNSIGEQNDSGSSYGACPTAEVMKLTVMDSSGQTAFKNKIKDLQAQGYTYHDAGMVWGARLISPDGLFANENATAENGRPIGRHIIFMTDGEMNTPIANYSHQGMERVIERIGAWSNSEANKRHTNRFVQLCQSAKAKGIVVWVIGFGDDVGDDEPLNNCASQGRAYQAGTNEQLEKVFQQIANQISKLRLSK
ncbi:TadE/TadG family type IV pilus assembly protein [Sphingopyxis sp. MWB1]|uniref:TadE/TadG family type IV pilus assembly protein n=1 Tax=Sphingopyxis sp. MWB1 TaxID=1537715 RepID=UPI000AA4CBE3|nr:TadE/TadG family type IV pilus assembly protein [Sphingopyxis sp. MWB1]